MSATGEPGRRYTLRAGWCLVAFFFITSTLNAESPTLADLTPLERLTPDFYGAIATGSEGIETEWLAERSVVPIDGEFTLTLIVKNAANPRELTRPDLRSLPAFEHLFQIADGAETSGQFSYRLRPRAVGDIELPLLKYRYYRPAYPAGKRFPTTYPPPITIRVTPVKPKAVPVSPPVPIDAPASFFTTVNESDRPMLSAVSVRLGLLPIVLVPPLVGIWVFAWSRFFPDAARRVKLRRHRAARLAFDQLKRASNGSDSTVPRIVQGYLQNRLGLPGECRTPREIADGLRLLGRPEEMVAEAEDFFRACDEARFATSDDTTLSLTARAEACIENWEGAMP